MTLSVSLEIDTHNTKQVEASGDIKNSTCGIPKCNWNVGCFVDDATGFRGSISTVKLVTAPVLFRDANYLLIFLSR